MTAKICHCCLTRSSAHRLDGIRSKRCRVDGLHSVVLPIYLAARQLDGIRLKSCCANDLHLVVLLTYPAAHRLDGIRSKSCCADGLRSIALPIYPAAHRLDGGHRRVDDLHSVALPNAADTTDAADRVPATRRKTTSTMDAPHAEIVAAAVCCSNHAAAAVAAIR
ncbi:MAG: hypothetical protein LBP90_04865, partial [Burkholderiales bacterium]|nr:hypothetical protein [Burkholderiales bacterium]